MEIEFDEGNIGAEAEAIYNNLNCIVKKMLEAENEKSAHKDY